MQNRDRTREKKHKKLTSTIREVSDLWKLSEKIKVMEFCCLHDWENKIKFEEKKQNKYEKEMKVTEKKRELYLLPTF